MNTPEHNFRFRVGQHVVCRLTLYPGIVTKNRLDERGEPLVEVLVNQYGTPPYCGSGCVVNMS
jgi:hypothetical protein